MRGPEWPMFSTSTWPVLLGRFRASVGYMKTASSLITQVARRFAAVVAECDYAQHRIAITPALAAARVPGTYRDFLRQTSGPLLREPSAAERMTGAKVG